jgi:purine-binding chemotaxis protein CheW
MGSFQVEMESSDSIQNELNENETRQNRKKVLKSRNSGSEQIVEFVIGDEKFAIDLFDTREVINTPEVTPIPSSPSYVTGMIDLRGVITIIIDPRVLMKINRESTGKKKSRIIVLDKTVSDKRIGILVDDVSSVTTVSHEDIDTQAHSSSQSGRDILGVIRKHKKDVSGKDTSSLILWLDIRRMVGRIEKDL